MGGLLVVSEAVEAHYGDRMDAAAPGLARFVYRAGGPGPEPDAVEALYFSADVFPERSREFAVTALKAERLRWLHTFSAGVDDPFFRTLLGRGVRVSTSSGAHAEPIAQTVMLYLLALTRDLRGWLDDQAARRWNPRGVGELSGLRTLVLGMGPIGREIARLGLAFGMEVTGLRRSPRGDEPCPTHPLAELDARLPGADVVIAALPLAEETRGLLDAERIARMKPGVLFVNIGRGQLVDERALTDALASGHVGGAGLDVFEQEPLPEASRLWALPNVIVTPHSSGTSPGNHLRATEIFLDNLARYGRGEGLRNEVAGPDGSA